MKCPPAAVNPSSLHWDERGPWTLKRGCHDAARIKSLWSIALFPTAFEVRKTKKRLDMSNTVIVNYNSNAAEMR